MEELKRKLFQREVSNLLLIYSEEKAYELFIEFINEFHGSINDYDSKELDEIFPKPHSFTSLNKNEINEFGDTNTNTEYTDEVPSLVELNEFGWLNDIELRKSIRNDAFYKNKVLKSIGDMPIDVKNEIELNATHILGRCNNPENWGENIQGLVYGMVQSGKTASMMTLMGLAKSAGYRLFIVLSSDKDSLRTQTQKRINESFDLNTGGYSKDSNNKVRSITTLISDYSLAARGHNNFHDFWNLRDKKECLIICIKKQKDNLKLLLRHLKEIENTCESGGIYDHNFSTDFKTMILDDEADFASQDTSSTGNGTTIHNYLNEIRKILKQNTYVAYTATPQACIGANPEKLIGYPKDFIWLLEPHRKSNGETSTYLGLEEFFEKFPNQLITLLSDDSWPHVEKEDGVRLGIYSPRFNTIDIDNKKLSDIELDHLDHLINNKSDRDEFCEGFKIAMTDFLIGCSIRWYRHYLKCQSENFFTNTLPTIEEIEEIEIPNTPFTSKGYKPFPYHAMMFNLAYVNVNQIQIINLIEILWGEIKSEFKEIKSSQWQNESNIFLTTFQKQLEKSKRFEMNIPTSISLEPFIENAIKIAGKLIHGMDNKYVYLLNSLVDEGTILRYDSNNKTDRPKKAAIVVGGNILGRGLTIENLSTTIFVRSQVMSLGDTNLQMCRWFGHKKNHIDLQGVYMQDHTFELFQNISEADRQLRHQFKFHIYHRIPNKCLLLQLHNSPLFKSTSPSKMRDSSKHSSSYSGITVDLLQHIKHKDFLKNSIFLDQYLLKLNNSHHGNFEHGRAIVYRDVPVDDFINFFNNLNVTDDALNISPKTYLKYLQNWRRDFPRDFPQFNVAIFDVDSNGEYRERARKINGVIEEFNTREECIKSATTALKSFRGGKSSELSQQKYCGDFLIDFPEEFHHRQYHVKNLRRPKHSPILFIFYKLKANYVGKCKRPIGKVYFEEGDKLYIETKDNQPVITFSISTPLGGPVNVSVVNNKVKKMINNSECEKYYRLENE
jgi:hypothetical protein